MTISYVGSTSAAATSLGSLHASRALLDIEIMWGWNNASTTSPTVPSGWKKISSLTGSTCALVVAYRYCTSTSDTSGTWTNATHLVCEIYRGVLGVGDTELTSGTTAAITYPAVFPVNTGGASWVAFGVGQKTATSVGTTPTGLTARTTVGSILASFDSNTGVSSFSSKSSTANTTAAWVSIGIELLGAKSIWAPEAHTSDYALSTDCLTAKIASTPGAIANAVTSFGRTSGKFVVKITCDLNTAANQRIGFGQVSNLTGDIGGTTSSFGWQSNGSVWFNNAQVGAGIDGWTSGTATALYMAIDFGAGLWWGKVGVAGNWNASGTANPDTGVGGRAFSSPSFGDGWRPMRETAQFGGSDTGVGFVFDGDASGHGLTTFKAWNDLSTGASGTLAVTDTPDTAAVTASVGSSGSMAVTDTSDTAALTGSLASFGALGATEAADTAAFTGLMAAFGSLTVTGAVDTMAATGTVVTSGTLTTTDGADIPAIAISVGSSGALSVSDLPDVAALTATIISSGALSVTEGADVFVAAGVVGNGGALVVTDAADVASFVAELRNNAIFAVTDSPDLPAFTGGTLNTVALNVTDGADLASFSAQLISTMALATVGAKDQADFVGNVFLLLLAVQAESDRVLQLSAQLDLDLGVKASLA